MEIDDAMVERGAYALHTLEQPGCGHSREQKAKAVLEAALNPPAAPEIVVTAAQLRAGRDAWAPHDRYSSHFGGSVTTMLADIYRAMRALEPKAETPDIPKIYDISINTLRPVTQADIDSLKTCVQAFGVPWRLK